MKLEKHIERLAKKVCFIDDLLYEVLDFVMKSDKIKSTHNLLKEIIERYEKNDKDFKNVGAIIFNDKRVFHALKAKFTADFTTNNNFQAVEKYAHFFDDVLHLSAGIVCEDGRIGFQKYGAETTFCVGLPIYDLENNKIGVLSYVCDEKGWYWWQILGYKGKRQKIKTHWQVLKEKA